LRNVTLGLVLLDTLSTKHDHRRIRTLWTWNMLMRLRDWCRWHWSSNN